MAELIIARVNEQGVQARDLSETFSGKNEIFIKGQQANAGGSCVATLNGISLKAPQVKGLGCIHLTESGVQDRRTFDFSIANDNTKFTTWIGSLTTGIVLFLSHSQNAADSAVTTFFNSAGSVGWAYHWDETKGTHRSSYVAIYDIPLKKLMTEQFMGHGATSHPAQLSVVYDTFDDIGSTGYGDTIVWDENERATAGTSTDYQGYNYLRNVKLSEFNINAGETIEFTAELMKSRDAHVGNAQSAMFVQFYNAGKWVKSEYITTTSSDPELTWVTRSKKVVVPTGVDEINVSQYRYPRRDGTSGEVYARDLVVKLAKPAVAKTGSGSIGQWGFITETAIETSPPVATVDGKNFLTTSYDALDEEWLPKFDGTGYFDIPTWQVTGNFIMSQTISFDYPSNGTSYMISGQSDYVDGGYDNRLNCGIRTVAHASGEAWYFAWGEKAITIPVTTAVEYGRPYTFRIEVVNNIATCFVDGTIIGTINPTNKTRLFPYFAVGADGRLTTRGFRVIGSVHELNLIDSSDERNSRYYNFVLPGQLDDRRTVPGKSRFSGKTYELKNVQPNPSGYGFYCGVQSELAPYGLQAGDIVYVSITNAGGNTLNDATINTRYKATVVAAPEASYTTPYSQFLIVNPSTGTTTWIKPNAGGTQTTTGMRVNIEYVANPAINGTVTNIDWENINTLTHRFGAGYVDIPQWTGPGEFSLKFNLKSFPPTASSYLFDGRTNTNTAASHIYVNRSGIVNGGTNLVIASVNDIPFVAGQMQIELNTDYRINGYFTSGGINRIGARFSNNEIFDGNIWDFSMKSETDSRYYKNIIGSRYTSTSTNVIDSNGKNAVVYRSFDINDWNLGVNVERVNSKSFKFNQGITPSGIYYTAGMLPYNRYQIDYDITTTSQTEIRMSSSPNGSAPLVISLPIGRAKGSVGVVHTTGDNPGVYIRTVNPKVNETVIVNRLKVTATPTSGIASTVTDYEKFIEPNMRTTGMKLWGCNFVGGSSVATPFWVPNNKNFRIQVKLKIGATSEQPAPIISGIGSDSSTKNSIHIDHLAGKTIRFYGFGSTGASVGLVQVNHNLSVGTDATVIAEVVNGQMSVTVNGVKSNSVAWTGSGSERVRYIGFKYQGTSYNSVISLVDLIDTTGELANTMRYDLTRSSSVRPTQTNIPNDVEIVKYIRIGETNVAGKLYGWDRTTPKEIGKFKDGWYIVGGRLNKLGTINTSGYSAYFEFENNIKPVTYFDIELFNNDINNNAVSIGTFSASQYSNGYAISENSAVTAWFADVNANKKMVFKPRGVGSDAFASASAWAEL